MSCGPARSEFMPSRFVFLRILALLLLAVALYRSPVVYYTGTVAAVDVDKGRLIIDRDPPDSGGPVTRISYVHTGRRDLGEFKKGDRVQFAARSVGDVAELSGIWQRAAASPSPADSEQEFGHHHNPHHGGYVGMVGEYHVEAVAEAGGLVRAYVSDFSRRPLPLRGFFGKATMHDGDVHVTRALGRMSTSTGPALGGRFDPFDADEIVIEFDLVRGEENINIEFLLPIERVEKREAVMPKRCESMQRSEYYAVTKPWCTLDFGRQVTALAMSAAGDTVVVAALEHPVSAWSLPDGGLRSRFEADPQSVPASGGERTTSSRTTALAPHAAEVLVAGENRLLRYATEDGRYLGLLGQVDAPVLDARWSAAGDTLLALLAGGTRLIRVDAGSPVPAALAQGSGEIKTFAVRNGDGFVAVARADGSVSVIDPTGAGRSVAMSTKLQGVASLVFAGEYLAAASKQGVVRVWHAGTGGQVAERPGLPSQLRVASDPTGRRLVTGDVKGVLRLFTVPALRPGLQMEFHRTAVTGLAWAGESIVSSDLAGRVAVWRFAPPAP